MHLIKNTRIVTVRLFIAKLRCGRLRMSATIAFQDVQHRISEVLTSPSNPSKVKSQLHHRRKTMTQLAQFDTFTMERTFAAPLARVFQAFSDPHEKKRWFAEGAEHEI